MKKILVILACLLGLSSFITAQENLPTNQSSTIGVPEISAEEFDEAKTKTEIIVPTNQHTTDQNASVKIEYLPMYDEVRIYYDCLYVSYDRGEAMNTVIQCLADFQQEHKYYSYRYLRNDKERFFKDDKGRRKAQYMSYVKFSR